MVYPLVKFSVDFSTFNNKGKSDGESNKSNNNWHEGSFDSPEESLQYHYDEHGTEVNAANAQDYANKANNFANNRKGAEKSFVDGCVDNVTRYSKNGKYVDIAPDGRIVSFGRK